MTLVDNEGTPLQAPQKLPAGVRFSAHDGFVTMANGDVVWTASVNGNLTLFRLPKGGGGAPARWIQVPGLAKDIGVSSDGTAWIIGTDAVPGGFRIRRMAPGETNWTTIPDGAVSVSGGGTNTAWVVNDKGAIFKWQ